MHMFSQRILSSDWISSQTELYFLLLASGAKTSRSWLLNLLLLGASDLSLMQGLAYRLQPYFHSMFLQKLLPWILHETFMLPCFVFLPLLFLMLPSCIYTRAGVTIFCGICMFAWGHVTSISSTLTLLPRQICLPGSQKDLRHAQCNTGMATIFWSVISSDACSAS